MIDFRSDTVTVPCQEMLKAMLSAPVGDDVFAEDPTTNQLQDYVAKLFGKECALFCPSGTMSNQIAIAIQTETLSEVILEELSHVFIYEVGGIAYNSRASIKSLKGQSGKITAKQIELAINPDDIHQPESSLVCIENPTNKGGGACYKKEELAAISKLCRERGLKVHLDGARLFNALTETKDLSPRDIGSYFDTISICLSKGLGAPLGSILLLDKKDYRKALRMRKAMGGGMRQTGHMAACGLYALKNNIDRLKEDHKLAKSIAEVLDKQSYVQKILPVETNIVIAELNDKTSPADFISYLKENQIMVTAFGGQQVRFVTHKDLPSNSLEAINTVLGDF